MLIQRSSVDFGEPYEPMIAMTSPSCALRERPRSTSSGPKRFTSPEISRANGAACNISREFHYPQSLASGSPPAKRTTPAYFDTELLRIEAPADFCTCPLRGEPWSADPRETPRSSRQAARQAAAALP